MGIALWNRTIYRAGNRASSWLAAGKMMSQRRPGFARCAEFTTA